LLAPAAEGTEIAPPVVWYERREGIKVWIGGHRYPDACPATAPPRRRIVEVADVMGKQGSSHEMRRAGPCPALPCPALPCPAIEGGRGKADPNGRQRAMGWTCLTRGGELAGCWEEAFAKTMANPLMHGDRVVGDEGECFLQVEQVPLRNSDTGGDAGCGC
jgi:hypothetical protein